MMYHVQCGLSMMYHVQCHNVSCNDVSCTVRTVDDVSCTGRAVNGVSCNIYPFGQKDNFLAEGCKRDPNALFLTACH